MSESQLIELPAVLDISKSELFLDSMRSVLEDADDITLDARNVQRIHTPAIQILLGALAHAEKENMSVNLTHISDAFDLAFRDLGLASALTPYRDDKEEKE